MQTKKQTNLSVAQDYAMLGWRVFPIWEARDRDCSCPDNNPSREANPPYCGSPGKHPATANGLIDASTNPEIIKSWWYKRAGANIGIATGFGSGIVVLDVDLGKDGPASLKALEAKHGDLPATLQATTGSGGKHYFFKHPGKQIKNSQSKLGKGLDIRGDGGYVVGAPSNHVTGGFYSWDGDITPDQYTPAEMPKWMIEALYVKPEGPAGQIGTGEAASRCKKYLEKCQDAVSGQDGHGRTLVAACECFRFGLTESEAWGLLCWFNDLKCQPKWSERELRHKMKEGRKLVDREGKFGDRLESIYKASPRAATHPAPTETEIEVADTPTKHITASQTLGEMISGIIDGSLAGMTTPWPLLDHQTQMFVPGTVTTICGDAGVGKTFISLDLVEHLRNKQIDCACFYIEKNRDFHTHRLLAMLEGRPEFLDRAWIASADENADAIQDAMDRHSQTIDELGRFLYSPDTDIVTLASLREWTFRMAAEGKRAIVIDPISLADAGQERWDADTKFMRSAQRIVEQNLCSLILITHPKSGTRPGQATAGAESGGKAYRNAADTNLWLTRPKKPKKVKIETATGDFEGKYDYFMEIHKARFGPGSGRTIAMKFGKELRFREVGIVSREPASEEPEEALF